MNTNGLRPYQIPHAASLLRSLCAYRSAIDCSDPRTGKTYSALAVARALSVVPLVFCPKVAMPGWRKAARDLGTDVEVVNYEKARGKNSPYGEEVPWGSGSFWRWKYTLEFAIFDEVHRCGGSTTKNSKMLIAARRQFGKVLMLSATLADSPEQLKAVGFALGLFTLKTFRFWLMKHGCVPGIFGGFTFTDDPWERDAALLKINKAIFPAHGSRIKKSDIPGFPRSEVTVKLLPPEDKALKLATELKALFDAKTREADASEHHLTKITKLRQSLELLKVPDLVELAEHYAASGAKIAIFVNYRQTIVELQKYLAKAFKCERIPVIDGENNDETYRDTVRHRFQNDEFPVLLLNSAAGGEGISLHHYGGTTERVQLISPTYSVKVYKQVLGRPQAVGAAFSQSLLLAFEGTIEQDVAEDALSKQQNLGLVNDAVISI